MSEPDNLVLKLLREMRGEVSDVRQNMATKEDVADVRSEMHSLRADVASTLILLEKRLGDQIDQLNRSINGYRS